MSQLPAKGAPELAAVQAAFADFCTTIAALRDPEHGCPWDLEQDHKSLRRYMIEEAYEAAEAMASGPASHICEELGDVLLQVVLNAQVAQDQGDFSIVDVISGINAKMRRRHPHVFAAAPAKQDSGEAAAPITKDDVKLAWAAIKEAEKARATAADGRPAAAAAKPESIFASAAKTYPSTAQALKIGKLAAKINFDWSHTTEVFSQLRSEVDEVAAELKAGVAADKSLIAAEIGDVFFTLAQLCRHLELDPETCALDGNRKFMRRFAVLESLAEERNIDVRTASHETFEMLWLEAKKREKAPQHTSFKTKVEP